PTLFRSASVVLTGSTQGVVADEQGAFEITITSLPATLTVTSVNFEAQEVLVVNTAFLTILLKPMLGQEIIVSASRQSERLLESPVTVERVSAAVIRNTPAASYYDIIGKLKGVDVVNASLTFTSPTTRGFAGSGNTRFNQQVDGIDNQAPALNFSVGSVVGLTELDVESMGLLPGASSALYGSGGMNGTLLVTSKNP